MKIRTYYGYCTEENRTIYATVTGQMSDGTLVYTEIEQREDGSIVLENGEPKLILDNQYKRWMRRGCQTFEKL